MFCEEFESCFEEGDLLDFVGDGIVINTNVKLNLNYTLGKALLSKAGAQLGDELDMLHYKQFSGQDMPLGTAVSTTTFEMADQVKRLIFVVSAGLFDYLNERLAAALLRRMWDSTAEGGEVIVGNFHTSNPDRAWMEWCGDWHLIHRDEEDMLYLCHRAGVPTETGRFHYEPTGINMFLRIAKD